MMRTLRYVEVEWDDAISACEWCDLAHVPKVVPCVSRGWLIIDTKAQVSVASTMQMVDGGQVGEIISIPRGMVKRIRKLKVSYGL